MTQIDPVAKRYASMMADACNLMPSMVENQVEDLLIEYGPDGHCDGAEVITHYIMCLLPKATGSLRQAAMDLRAAQREYMADRGNAEKGMAVGAAAVRLDEVLSAYT